MSGNDADLVPSDIEAGNLVFDLAFHPNNDVLALGCIDGSVQIHGYKPDETTLLYNVKAHKDGVRGMSFTRDGSHLYTVSSDSSIKAIDCNTHAITFDKRDTGHDDALNAIRFLDENMFVTGCDGGIVTLWDRRQFDPVTQFDDLYGMGILSFEHNSQKGHILAGSDDGSLAVFGMRMAEAEVLTTPNDDGAASLCLIGGGGSDDPNNSGTHLAVGCNSGNIRIWKYGVWDKTCDNLKGHPCEVEGILQLRDGDVITACCDGVLRAVRLTPTPKLLDTVGHIEDAASMRLARARCGGLIGCAGGETISFCDVRALRAGTSQETPHGQGFLKQGTAEDEAAAAAQEGEDADSDEDSDDSDKEEEKEEKKPHQKGRHRVDFVKEGKQQQQKDFFKGL